MRKWLNRYFELTRSEFNGMLALVTLILAINAVPYAYDLVKTGTKNDHEAQMAIKNLFPAGGPAAGRADDKPYTDSNRAVKERVLFRFDPNTIGATEWQKLGLSARQSASVLKYINKGGKFRKPEDLQKMYTISNELYKKLVPYVQITGEHYKETGFKETDKIKRVYPAHELKIIEINGADSSALEEIRGIGPAFSRRIIKYREQIGGFYKKEQLMEVFGLDSVKYKEIREQVIVNVIGIRKININTAEFEDFKRHPYIRYKQINALIQYRKQHGNYSNIADLNKVVILNPETIERMAPYLTF